MLPVRAWRFAKLRIKTKTNIIIYSIIGKIIGWTNFLIFFIAMLAFFIMFCLDVRYFDSLNCEEFERFEQGCRVLVNFEKYLKLWFGIVCFLLAVMSNKLVIGIEKVRNICQFFFNEKNVNNF